MRWRLRDCGVERPKWRHSTAADVNYEAPDVNGRLVPRWYSARPLPLFPIFLFFLFFFFLFFRSSLLARATMPRKCRVSACGLFKLAPQELITNPRNFGSWWGNSVSSFRKLMDFFKGTKKNILAILIRYFFLYFYSLSLSSIFLFEYKLIKLNLLVYIFTQTQCDSRKLTKI